MSGRTMTRQPSPFGVLLKRHRLAAGLTQEELAEGAGLSARAISDLERGVSPVPRLYTVRQLIQALHLSGADRAAFEEAARHGAACRRSGALAPPGRLLCAWCVARVAAPSSRNPLDFGFHRV